MPVSLPIPSDDRDGAVILRGTKQGLEVQIQRFDSVDHITAELRRQFAKAPAFFRGEDMVLRFSGVPVLGSFGPIEAVARDFGLRVVAVRSDIEGSRKHEKPEVVAEPEPDPDHERIARLGDLAEVARAAARAACAAVTAADDAALEPAVDQPLPAPGSQMIIGPVRSGSVLQFEGDVTIVGDVNPGAEVYAGGSIIVLGALRGIAHAACTDDAGFIWATNLQPQQLRIGKLVARAADADQPSGVAEIAFAKDGQIIVEAYGGRLPRVMARLKS